MRRLVVTGFPCAKEAWQRFLPPVPEQRILSFAETLSRSASPDLRDLSRVVADEIASYGPESIVCHDFGSMLTLSALLGLRKRGAIPRARLTSYSGAFRGFDVLRARHPFHMQWVSWDALSKNVGRVGGEADPALEPLLPKVRALYRQVIATSLLGKLKSLVSEDRPLAIDFGIPFQVIASTNDPFIPLPVIRRLGRDFKLSRFIEARYGHFPYSTRAEPGLAVRLAEFERDS